VYTVVADAGRAALLTVVGDAVANPVKAGQLLEVIWIRSPGVSRS
jgi:hypothetical protein